MLRQARWTWAVILAAWLVALACGQAEQQATNDSTFGGGGGGGGGKSDDDDDAAAAASVVVVYGSTAAEPKGYATLLEDNGYTVKMVTEANFPSVSLTGVKVLISDTTAYWLNQNSVAMVKNSGVPVIGVFEGGGDLFDYLGLNLGWANGYWSYAVQQVRVVDPGHPVFTTPFDLGVTDDELITVMASPADFYYHDTTPPWPNVLPLADRPVETGFAGITVERGKYLYWPFDDMPGSLSTLGQQLFINCVHYLATQ
jgi:hypothetical protein